MKDQNAGKLEPMLWSHLTVTLDCLSVSLLWGHPWFNQSEILSVLLMAAHFDVKVCPHAGALTNE